MNASPGVGPPLTRLKSPLNDHFTSGLQYQFKPAPMTAISPPSTLSSKLAGDPLHGNEFKDHGPESKVPLEPVCPGWQS